MEVHSGYSICPNVAPSAVGVRRIALLVLGLIAATTGELVSRAIGAAVGADASETDLRVQWRDRPADGAVEVREGELASLTISPGQGRSVSNGYHFEASGPATWELSLRKARLGAGGGATIVRIGSGADGFAFFARDVSTDFPIFLPDRGVAVSLASDSRSYQELLTPSASAAPRLNSRASKPSRRRTSIRRVA